MLEGNTMQLKIDHIAFNDFLVECRRTILRTTYAYVFSADRKVMLIKDAPGAKSFTPSSNEVLKADSLLSKYLSNSRKLAAIGNSYHSYFRQHIGVENPGLKGIYINAF